MTFYLQREDSTSDSESSFTQFQSPSCLRKLQGDLNTHPHHSLHTTKHSHTLLLHIVSFPSFRYFLALQLKEDLLNEKLFCSEDTLAVMNSLIVQGEAGDFDPVDHSDGYLDDFPSLEDKPLEFKSKVAELHQRNQ